MRKLLLILPILCLPVFAEAPPKATAKKPAIKTAPAKTAKPAAKPAKTTAKTTKTSTKKKAAAPARTAQQHPTSERYTEIQQALVDRGYLEQASGNWDAASVAAMKKFQEDQALHVDGKLGALTLTALGLGPRRGAFVVAPMVPANSTVAAVE